MRKWAGSAAVACFALYRWFFRPGVVAHCPPVNEHLYVLD
jgi:hypothetical protein